MHTLYGVYVTQYGVYMHIAWGVYVTQSGVYMCTQCGLCSGEGYCEVLSSLTVFCPNTLLGYIYQHACVCTFELDVCVTGSLGMEVRGQLVGGACGSNPGPQVWWQALLLSHQSCQPTGVQGRDRTDNVLRCILGWP